MSHAGVVQTHMTNPRLTDPEVLKFRFPMRLDGYEIRASSGGADRCRGDGRREVPGHIGSTGMAPGEVFLASTPGGRLRHARLKWHSMHRLIGACLFLAAVLSAAALPLPKDELERSCWQRYTTERTRVNVKEPTLVAFSNLRSGDRFRSPFLVEFAVRGMGVAPAGKAQAGTGHHHLLVNAPLPAVVTEKIPFNDKHKHFGKGQTQVVLDLPPGRHTLRLLFADHEHRPYFVYSREIKVTVVGPRTAQPLQIDPRNFDASCAAWYQDELARPRPPGEWVSIINLRDGETVSSPFNLRFGVEGYGVCAEGQVIERTGRFVLELLKDGAVVRTQALNNGATQTSLALPNGSYRLRLRFVDATGRNDLLPASESAVTVAAQARL